MPGARRLITERAVSWAIAAIFLPGFTPAAAQEPVTGAALPACPPGWKVEVIAETPKINHPTVVCCAPDGRVFVAEDPMDISAPAHEPLGRILCFRTGGEMPVTVFAERLHAVFGMQYLEGKLHVLHNPKLTVFADDDGVGRDRVDLIENTNPNPWALGWNDHVPANFKLAMDGYFYVSVGDKGVYGAVGRDGKRVDLFGGGILRLRPDATELEVFSTGTRNHLDLALNAEDEVFTYDNTDEKDWWSRVTHMVDGGYYGYPWDHKPPRPFILPPLADYGAGAATATVCYEEDALPEEYRGNLFLADWGRREVFRLRIARAGGTYNLVAREEFLSNAPPDFRPVGFCLAPDGLSFYVTDWRHPDTKAKVDAGRLLRVSFTGASCAAPKPAWYLPAVLGRKCSATDDALLAGLRHPSHAVRMCAGRRLAERGRGDGGTGERGDAVSGALAALVADPGAPPSARWHAIWALDAIDGGLRRREAILSVLKDADATVRMQAARQLGTRRARKAVAALVEMLRDPEAAIRRQAAAALGRIGDPSVVPSLVKALVEEDVFARQAVFTALNRIGRTLGESWKEIARGLESLNPRVREGTLFALRETFEPGVVAVLSSFVRDARRPADARASALHELSVLHRKPPPWKGEWWAYHPVELPRPKRTVEWEGTAIVLTCLREMLGDPEPLVRRAAVDGLREAGEAAASSVLCGLFEREPDLEVRRSLLRAFAEAKDARAESAIRPLLEDPAKNAPLVKDALFVAERIGAAELIRGALPRLLKARPADGELLLRTIEALGRTGGEPAWVDLLPLLEDRDAAVRRAAIGALGGLKSKKSLDALLGAFGREKGDAKLDAARALVQMPDVRALDAFLLGLAQKNAALRGVFRGAVAAVKDEALPWIEKRLDAGGIEPLVVSELRRVYSTPRPIARWRLLGPVPLAVPAPPEAAVNGRTEGWAQVEAGTNGWVDLDRILLPGSRTAAYGLAIVPSPAARSVELLAGSGGPLEIWLNGVKVHETSIERKWGPRQDRVAARLKAGTNHLLVRTEDLGGGAAFSVEVPEGGSGPLFEKDLNEPDPAAYLEFALKNPGDPEHGRKLFEDQKGAACVKCHAVKGAGGGVGPDLAGVGLKYDRAYLAESILFPSRIVRPDYQQVVVVTKAGDVKAGLVRGETAEELTLVDVEGAKHAIQKDELAQRETSELSVMPEGLSGEMSPQDFADIVAYLERLKN